MSNMELKEAYERFYHGMRKASDCAKKLAHSQKDKNFLAIAASLDMMCAQGTKLYESPGLSPQESLNMVDRLMAKNVIQQSSKRLQ